MRKIREKTIVLMERKYLGNVCFKINRVIFGTGQIVITRGGGGAKEPNREQLI